MTSKFNKLTDVAEVIDSLHKTPKYSETGRSMVRCTDVKYGALDLTNTFKVNDEVFAEFSRRYTPTKNDIVITRVGSYGITALVDDVGFCLGQNTSAIVPKAINPRYLYLTLNSPFVKNQIEFSVVGSTQKTLSLKAINNLDIPRFEPKVEDKFAKIVGELDDKIELNSEINQTLEQIAQAIFKSWFVDFEPTRAKIAAKQNGQDPERAAMAAISGKTLDELDQLSPEQQAQLKTTAALFPDSLVDSELGQIPEGWVLGCIGDISKAKGGYAFKSKSFIEQGNPVVKIKNITGDGRVDLAGCQCVDDSDAGMASRFKLRNGDLLMAMTGATVGKIGFVITEGKDVYLNQRVAKFESEQFGSQISSFLYCCFQRDSIFDSVVGTAHGSAQANISSSGIESTKLVLPQNDLITLFCEKTESLFKKWRANINENSRLGCLRDTLLPKLLSGDLSVEPNQTELEQTG